MTNKSKVRIRATQQSGAVHSSESKWYSPQDDIRNCFHAVTKAALTTAFEMYPEYGDDLCGIAEIVAKYNGKAAIADGLVHDLLADVREAMLDVPTAPKAIFMTELSYAMMQYFGTACRETSHDAEIQGARITKITAQGSILSALPEEERVEVVRSLRREQVLCDELSREPLEGVYKQYETKSSKPEGDAEGEAG
jgi:hypothetical protein